MKYFILFLFSLTIYSAPSPITQTYNTKDYIYKYKWVPGDNFYTFISAPSGKPSHKKKYPLDKLKTEMKSKSFGKLATKFYNKIEAYKSKYSYRIPSSRVRATTTTQTTRR